MDDVVVSLLAGHDPGRTSAFIQAWGEARAASWANAAREAENQAASHDHVSHLRGQLRHQMGEAALRDAAKTSGIGALAMQTRPRGGVFMIARLGRFGLVSMALREHRGIPRRSATRSLLSEPNISLERQSRFSFGVTPNERGATELAYFGCLIAVRAWPDPSAPSELVIGVPTVALDDWIVWLPIERAQAILVGLSPRRKDPGGRIPDRAFPKFRLPERDDDASGASADPTKK